MKLPKRLPIIVLAVTATALTITGITIAATDSNPVAAIRDPLALNGYPPLSTRLLLSVSTGTAHSLSAVVNIDFSNNALEAVTRIPVLVSNVPVDLRALGGKIYVGSTLVPGGAYAAAPLNLPQLYGLSLEMTKPDIALITGLGQPMISTSGYTTSYTFHRGSVALSNVMGASGSLAGLGALELRISVGSQGEATGALLSITSANVTTVVSLKVLAYNQKVSITAPSVSAVRNVSGSTLRQLLKLLNLGRLMMPANLFSLGQLRLN